MKKLILIITFLCISIVAFSALYKWNDWGRSRNSPLNPKKEKNMQVTEEMDPYWAENQLKKMSLEEKIAQLLMIRVHSNYVPEVQEEILRQVEQYQVGGVCFFQGGPVRQINLTNRLQKVSKIPLLISIDGEWGPAMRLDSCIGFPRQMALGAMDASGNLLLYEMGKEIAEQCKALGIHINFAPSVDVNNNPGNPVINSRSFGETRELVASKSICYMRGMQDNGLSACAKHFPGHGDTDTDSHHDLPLIKKSRKELDSLEFYPFRKIIDAGVDMVMVSHLNIPSLDQEENSISTLSYSTIMMLLKKEFAFDGIVITDAMDMSGLRKSYPDGADAEIKALMAGVDILLLPNDLETVITGIREAVEEGYVPEELVNEKCLKVLKLKESKGLTRFKKIPTNRIYEKLNSENAERILNEITAQTLTLLKNEEQLLPLRQKDSAKIALLCIGGLPDSTKLREISEQYGIGFIQTDRSINGKSARLMQQMAPYDRIIVAMLSTNQLPRFNYGIYQESVAFLNELTKNKKIILSLFGNPYSLDHFQQLSRIPAIIVGYQPTTIAVEKALKAIFGEASFEGKLPVSTRDFRVGSGISLLNTALTIPSTFSILPAGIEKEIDSIINNGISQRIFPGCQILAIQNGKTVFHKSYGDQTYNSGKKITASTLFDLASITKSAATSLAVMKLYDEGKLSLEDKIGNILPYLSGSDKAGITIAELLTHTSGLPAYIPFYKDLLENNTWNPLYMNPTPTPLFKIEAARGVYISSQVPGTILQKIADCKLGRKEYKYSDLGFILLKEAVEKISGQPFETYLTENFYRPLDLKSLCFNPLKNGIPIASVAPTENDQYFRMQVVHGYVHDQTAALFGGVCGHAGLFSNARDLAVIFQLLSNGGIYNGHRYLSNSCVELFTSTYPLHGCERRALGFDTPGFPKKSTILPRDAGSTTFGHQGFTGTVVWCDPENGLTYIFLSNRVYPDAEPNKLAKSGIRLSVHDAVYRGLNEPDMGCYGNRKPSGI